MKGFLNRTLIYHPKHKSLLPTMPLELPAESTLVLPKPFWEGHFNK
jgi:hypothetical protein